MDNLQPHFKIVCDLETSGDCPINNGVIAACILIIDENNNVVDEFVRYVKPPNLERRNWSLDAQGVHGITFEQAQTFMPNEQFCFELLCFLAKYRTEFPNYFICHASPGGWFDRETKRWRIIRWFDYNFLSWCFRKEKFQNGHNMFWTMSKIISPNHLISTVKMGRQAGYQKNSLDLWAERINFNLKHHDATSDTYCCLQLYKFLGSGNGKEKGSGNQLQINFDLELIDGVHT